MAKQTTKKRVTFKRPFYLEGLDGKQSAGTYLVETRVDHGGFFAFLRSKRTSTWIRTNRTPGYVGAVRTVNVDPRDLEAALARDAEDQRP